MVINAYKINDIIEKENKLDTSTIINEIVDKLILHNIKLIESKDRNTLKTYIKDLLINEYIILNEKSIKEIITAILDKIYGYGIFEKYIKDGITSDIRAVRYDLVYIKQKGKWIKTEDKFSSPNEFEQYIRFCALKNSYNINFENPIGIFSDRKNGLRIEAGIEPANVLNASLVIRIHRKEIKTTLEELFVKYNMLDRKSYLFLKERINKQSNIILCGKGGSGKTTLLRGIINELPNEIAITSNEETAELYLKDRNIIQRECILTRTENKNIDLEKLSRHSLVMSNDVIIIGELKGAEANSFFDSIATGHMGLATIHSDSDINTIDRIITLIKKDAKAIHYTEDFLRRFLSTTIDYIIYLKDFKVVSISKPKYNNNLNKMEFLNMYKGGIEKCTK